MVILSAVSVSAVGDAITVWETILPRGFAVSNATSIAAFTSETLPRIFTKKYYDSLLSINGDKGGKAVITAHRDDTVVLKVNDVKELTDMDVKL